MVNDSWEIMLGKGRKGVICRASSWKLSLRPRSLSSLPHVCASVQTQVASAVMLRGSAASKTLS